MKISTERYYVKSRRNVKLADCDTTPPDGLERRTVDQELMPAVLAEIKDLQERLWAENAQSLVVVLQGMDASGKDGTVKRVFSAVNPAGLEVTSFKSPTTEELSHDYLWRIQRALPARGQIGVFNRSHYEDVVTVRLHNLVAGGPLPERVKRSKTLWEDRFEQIRNWEKYLGQNGIVMVKVFLNISREEQTKRLSERLFTREKLHKFELSDITERQHWDEYQKLYADAIEATTTEDSPWVVVPADKKWYSAYVVACVVRDALRKMNPKMPEPARERRERVDELRELVESLLRFIDKKEFLAAADRATAAAVEAAKTARGDEAAPAAAAISVLREELQKVVAKHPEGPRQEPPKSE